MIYYFWLIYCYLFDSFSIFDYSVIWLNVGNKISYGEMHWVMKKYFYEQSTVSKVEMTSQCILPTILPDIEELELGENRHDDRGILIAVSFGANNTVVCEICNMQTS